MEDDHRSLIPTALFLVGFVFSTLCNSIYPGAHSVDQAGLELTETNLLMSILLSKVNQTFLLDNLLAKLKYSRAIVDITGYIKYSLFKFTENMKLHITCFI